MKRCLRVVFVVYLAVVGYGVFGPSPGEKLEQAGHELRKVEQEVRAAAPGGASEETPAEQRQPDRWIFGDLEAEDVGNIAMFVPFGVLFPLVWPRRRRWAIPAGVGLSGFIEAVQLVFLSWRSPSFVDVGWNSLGTVIGFGLWLVGSWCWTIRRRPTTPEHRPLAEAS